MISVQARPDRAGWYVVAALFVMLTLNAGFGFYALSSYSAYLVDVRGISLQDTSIGSTIFMVAGGVGGVVVARIARRTGMPRVILLGSVVTAASMPLIALAWTPVALWAVYLLYGIGSAGMAVVPASALIMEWFADKPARAIALATTGMSVGGAVLAPLVALWVGSAGLPSAVIGAAIIQLVVMVPLSLTVLALKRPSGSVDERVVQDTQVVAGDPAAGRTSLLDRHPWLFAGVCVMFALLFCSQVANITHLLLMTGERSIPDAALALTILAGTSVAGRLIGIPLLPRIGTTVFTIILGLFGVAAMTTIAFAHDRFSLYLGAFLLGVTVGNSIVMMPMWILRISRRADYSARYARANLWTSPGLGLAPLIMGLLHGAFGDYTGPFLVLAAGSAVATGIAAAMGRVIAVDEREGVFMNPGRPALDSVE